MTKITHRFHLPLIYCIVFMLIITDSVAQDTVFNKYGLWVINNIEQLQKTIDKNPSKIMIDLKKSNPSIILDLRYATINNFTKQKLYPTLKTTYLREPAARALSVIQKELSEKGLGIKIFDAYRPYSVTEKLWEPVKDDRYAADPKKGSGHNRGIAVDLTLINLSTNAELDMGTGFDNFSDTAHHAFTNLPPAILHNRLLLKKIMERHGFKALDTEWWHYYLPNANEYELLNLNFKQLSKLNKRNNGNTNFK